MRTRPVVLLALLVSAASSACGDRPLPSQAPPATRPAFDFTNNAGVSNPMIVRFEDRTGWLFDDPATGLFTIVSASNGEFGCARRTYLTLFDVQQILANPDDPASDKIHQLLIGKDAYVTVYQGPFDPSLTCEDLAARKLAQGIGSVVNTDSDLLIFLYPHNNWDAFGVTAHANVSLLAGGSARFLAVNRCTWDGNDLATLKCTTRVSLT